jgi:hypothetical protein
MNEKRRLPRKRPSVALHVTDTMTGDVVGHIGNLSLDGLLLLAQWPIIDDALYQLSFHLPDVHGRLHPIEVGAHEQWSAPGTMRGQNWVGFRFVDLGSEDEKVLRDWLVTAEDFTY